MIPILIGSLFLLIVTLVDSAGPIEDPLQIWKDDYTAVFTHHRRHLNSKKCLEKLNQMVEMEGTDSFKMKTLSLIERNLKKLTGSRFRNYHRFNNKFIVMSLLKKKKSYALNLIELSKLDISGCDPGYLIRLGALRFQLQNRSPAHTYYNEHFIGHLTRCRIMYLINLYYSVELLSISDRKRASNIYDSVPEEVRDLIKQRKQFAPQETLEKVADHLSDYLMNIDMSLSSFKTVELTSQVYYDEIREPCRKLCDLTENLLRYQERFKNFLRFISYPFIFDVDRGAQKWDKIKFCCAIRSLPISIGGFIQDEIIRKINSPDLDRL